jgi:hypothetical protein
MRGYRLFGGAIIIDGVAHSADPTRQKNKHPPSQHAREFATDPPFGVHMVTRIVRTIVIPPRCAMF